jgi:rubredoxin
MGQWECTACGWIYDEDVEGIPFAQHGRRFIQIQRRNHKSKSNNPG